LFDRWFAGSANNAGIVAAGLYADRVPEFAALLAAEGGDLPRFYSRVKSLAAMPKPQRDAALAAGGGASVVGAGDVPLPDHARLAPRPLPLEHSQALPVNGLVLEGEKH
jgi:hypothetical protein